MDVVKIKRFDVLLVNLDRTVGSEIKKTRPAVIISPNSMNLSKLKTVIIAPMTSTVKDNFPTRIMTEFKVDVLPALKRRGFLWPCVHD